LIGALPVLGIWRETLILLVGKAFVNNLRTKDNMLSSNLPADLRKTLSPTKAVRGVSPF